MSLLFGNLTEAFVTFGQAVKAAEAGTPGAASALPVAAANFRSKAAHDASYLVAIGEYCSCVLVVCGRLTGRGRAGCGMLVCTYTYMTTWVYSGEMNAKRIRERYLRAVLRQDIAFFDNVGAGEVATRIQTDTRECISVQGGTMLTAVQTSCSRASPKRSRSWSTSSHRS